MMSKGCLLQNVGFELGLDKEYMRDHKLFLSSDVLLSVRLSSASILSEFNDIISSWTNSKCHKKSRNTYLESYLLPVAVSYTPVPFPSSWHTIIPFTPRPISLNRSRIWSWRQVSHNEVGSNTGSVDLTTTISQTYSFSPLENMQCPSQSSFTVSSTLHKFPSQCTEACAPADW